MSFVFLLSNVCWKLHGFFWKCIRLLRVVVKKLVSFTFYIAWRYQSMFQRILSSRGTWKNFVTEEGCCVMIKNKTKSLIFIDLLSSTVLHFQIFSRWRRYKVSCVCQIYLTRPFFPSRKPCGSLVLRNILWGEKSPR